MTNAAVSHTKHDVPGSDGVWRPGATSHEESGTDLEGYLRPLEQAHLIALHGPGVASGMTLSATAGSGDILIGPGITVDPSGRHVVLAPGGFAELSETPEATSSLAGVSAEGVRLPTDGHAGRCLVTVAWRETFDKALLESSFQQKFLERQTPWLRLVDPADHPDDQAIVLGTVDLDGGVVAAGGVGPGGRHGVVPVSEGLRLNRSGVGAAGVTSVDAGALAVRPDRGLRLSVADAGAPLEILTDHVAVEDSDGTERLTADVRAGRLGIGVTAPTHALHVAANTGIRQNRLYLSGSTQWSSLTYNAHHDDSNGGWVFPDQSRPAVTIEMDDNGGRPRFEVWSTTPAATSAWIRRFAVDGTSGAVQIPGSLTVSGALTVAGGLDVTRDDANNVALVANNNSGAAFCATSNNGVALRAVGGRQAMAVIGPSSFAGAVDVGGQLTATAKSFVIDHPLDPENKILVHASVESDEPATVYSGNVALDDEGAAVVELPAWMEALNTDFRYQLTCLHQAAPVFIAREVSGGSFAIAGGVPGMTVSWQLSGLRQDHWTREHPLVVEEDKPEGERGYFRHPEVFGHERSRSVHYVRNEEALGRHPRLAHGVLDPGYGADRAH